MNIKLSRREFLKLLGLTTLSFTTSSNFLSDDGLQKKIIKGKSPNILILVLDTLSAGHMSTFGYQRQTTPNMTKFAERSNVYHNHYASGNFTSPSTASLLTGVYPWSHQAFNVSGTVINQFIDNNLFSLCNTSHFNNAYTHNVLVEILLSQFEDHIDQLDPMNKLGLAGESYSERFFPSDFPVALWSESILRGKDQFIPGSLFLSRLEIEYLKRKVNSIGRIYREKYPDGIPNNNRGLYFFLEHAIDWIQEQMVSLPQSFLAYHHLYPPHHPYRPRADFINLFDDSFRSVSKPKHAFAMGFEEEQMEKSRQRYDEYLAFVDSEFGRLITFMKKENVLENTIVILTSDHGELFERGIIGHETPTLFQNLLRVPLLISLPNQQNRKDIFNLTSCVDLLPTILLFSKHQIPDFIEGQLLPGFNKKEIIDERSVFALEAKSNSKFSRLENYTIAMIKGRYKLIRYHYPGFGLEIKDELYDLENDPEELENLNKSQSLILKDMKIELLEKLEEANQQYSQS